MDEKNKPSELAFDSALAKLEHILEKMNSGTVALEEALKLYEEADQLIAACNKRLNEAERKIEILIKNRVGEPALGPDGKPVVEPFNPNNGK